VRASGGRLAAAGGGRGPRPCRPPPPPGPRALGRRRCGHSVVGSLAYWCAADRAGALPSLLQAARLAPGHAATFTHLGLYYDEVEHDARKATKCYQRAVTLDPGAQEEAARRLYATYCGAGQDTAAALLLQCVRPGREAGEGPVVDGAPQERH
jgi:hypothetical protein